MGKKIAIGCTDTENSYIRLGTVQIIYQYIRAGRNIQRSCLYSLNRMPYTRIEKYGTWVTADRVKIKIVQPAVLINAFFWQFVI